MMHLFAAGLCAGVSVCGVAVSPELPSSRSGLFPLVGVLIPVSGALGRFPAQSCPLCESAGHS